MDSVKGRDISGCYTINGFAQALQFWVYTALPELGATFGNPLPNNPSPPILAYKGRKGCIQFKEAILSQTRVINFVQKDIGQMFPKWEFDVEDTPAENIIKLMFVKKPWKWTMDCWEVTEASEEAAVEASEEDIADAMREGFGTCLKEIKYLSERVEAVEKKSESVNGTNAGRKSLAEDKGPDVPAAVPAAMPAVVPAAVPADASSSKDKAPEPRLVLLDKNQPTVSDLQKEDARYQEKRDVALALCRAKSDRTRKLVASQQSPYTANSTARHIDAWINVLRKRYDANPQHFRSERMCFLDHLFAQQWRFNFKDFKDSEPDQNGLGRRLPGGAWNYYAGTIPSFCQLNKVWGTDIDDIYAPVNFADIHWIAMWISIPKRNIVVFDSICFSISPEELDVFSKKYFAKANGKTMRDKMAVDIFQELPDAHEFENKDNDDNLGAYDG
ncbi:unnamed protein product [Brassica oleracea]